MSITPQPSIAWEDVEAALVNWATDMLGIETIWEGENGPQPDRPYIGLDWLIPPATVGEDYFADEQDEDTGVLMRQLQGVRRAVVTVQAYSSSTRANENATYYLDLLANSLMSDAVVLKYFESVRMAPWDWTAARKGDFAEDKHAISRGAIDVIFGFSAGIGQPSESVQPIETVALTGTTETPGDEIVQAMTVASVTG